MRYEPAAPRRRPNRGGVPELVHEERRGRGRSGTRPGLGPDGRLLPIPQRRTGSISGIQLRSFAAIGLPTTAAKRYEKVPNATVVIWKALLMIAEQTFCRLDAPELLPKVAEGLSFMVYASRTPRWPRPRRRLPRE